MRMGMVTAAALLVLAVMAVPAAAQQQQPHFLVVVMDDMGHNDVGFLGSPDILTPTIDSLATAEHTVRLDNFYVQPLCSPTRAALLTGRYPIRSGMQHRTIDSNLPYGLPLGEKLLPQYLKECAAGNYSTHLIGKWHLGFFEEQYTPLRRGFDSFFGHYGGHHGYYDHEYRRYDAFGNWTGFDLRAGDAVDWSGDGEYITDLAAQRAIAVIDAHNASAADPPLFVYFPATAPHVGPQKSLEAPAEYLEMYAHIADEQRRRYAAVVTAFDDSLAAIVDALRRKELLNDTVILFISDNGGFPSDGGNNYPLRGTKETYFEGGIRVPAFLSYGAGLAGSGGRTHPGIFHAVDILPTLLDLAGCPIDANSNSNSNSNININSKSRGSSVRLAYSLYGAAGPYAVLGAVLNMSECVCCDDHLSSPDVIIDAAGEQLVMYFHARHTDPAYPSQYSFFATSANGIDWAVDSQCRMLTPPYLRVVPVGVTGKKGKADMYLATAKLEGRNGMRLYTAPAIEGPFTAGPTYFPNARHSALLLRGEVLYIFFTKISDCPEQVLLTTLTVGDLESTNSDDWFVGPPTEAVLVHRPGVSEGEEYPARPSNDGTAYTAENALRDPFVFVEEDPAGPSDDGLSSSKSSSSSQKLYLLYTIYGELGISMAEMRITDGQKDKKNKEDSFGAMEIALTTVGIFIGLALLFVGLSRINRSGYQSINTSGGKSWSFWGRNS